jgi:hypothetical protein
LSGCSLTALKIAILLRRYVRSNDLATARLIADELLERPRLIDGPCITELLFLAEQSEDERAIDSTLYLIRVAGIKLNISTTPFLFETLF